MSDITALQPVDRHSSALQRRKPRRFTLAFKLGGNGVMSALMLTSLIGAFWLATSLGIPGILFPVAMLAIMVLSSMAALEHLSHWGNAELKEASIQELEQRSPDLVSHSLGFVGLSTPGYLWRWQWVDTHEDVGMLCATPSQLVYRGDHLELTIPRRSVVAIQMRLDPSFSWIGLRWIRIDYQDGDEVNSVYVQSRDKNRLSQQASSNRALLERLQSWWQGSKALRSG